MTSLEDSEFLNLSSERERRIQEIQKEMDTIRTVRDGSGDYGRDMTFRAEKELIQRMAGVRGWRVKLASVPLSIQSS